MSNSLVSVIIPVYNVERYVKEAIQSIQNQTYKNLEIIVVDDGSYDNTYTIVEQLAKNDNRIKLYKNEKNLKIVKTLNRALSLANGEYIARMDGDDISSPDRIEKKVKFLKENEDIDLVGCQIDVVNEDSNFLYHQEMPIDYRLCRKVVKYGSPVLHIWVCKKQIYDILGGYREIDGVEDYDFLLRMISKSMKICNINKYLYKVRIREGNTATTSGLRQNKLRDYALKLFKERKYIDKDSFKFTKINDIYQSNKVKEFLYILSMQYVYNYGKYKKNKNYFKMFFYIILSLLSFPPRIMSIFRNRLFNTFIKLGNYYYANKSK